jgi:hypothetical protein
LKNHFTKGENEGLLASLVPRPEVRAELAFSRSWNAESQGSDPGLQLSVPKAVSVARSVFTSFMGFCIEGLRRLVDEQLVEHLLDESLESVSSGEQPLQACVIYRNLELSHLLSPRLLKSSNLNCREREMAFWILAGCARLFKPSRIYTILWA